MVWKVNKQSATKGLKFYEKTTDIIGMYVSALGVILKINW